MAFDDLRAGSAVVDSVISAEIVLDDATDFEVGDNVIIESDHGYDELGIDGEWTWSNARPSIGYYTDDALTIGKSFLGTIVSKSANNITLDRTVPGAAATLPIYRDNTAAIIKQIQQRQSWPAGETFAATGQLYAVVSGTGVRETFDFNGCEFFAPKGCYAIVVRITDGTASNAGVANKIFKNLTLRGNKGDAGYNFCDTGSTYQQGNSLAAAWAQQDCVNCLWENITSIDNWRAISVSNADRCVYRRCNSTYTQPGRQYIQWDFSFNSSRECVAVDCGLNSDFIQLGFEPFACENDGIGCWFIRCGGRNCIFASNTSGNVHFIDCHSTIDDANVDTRFFADSNPIMNIGRNAGSADPATSGGVFIERFRVAFNALKDGNRIYRPITVAPSGTAVATDCSIDGVEMTVRKDLIDAITQYGSVGGFMIDSDAAETIWDNVAWTPGVLEGTTVVKNVTPQAVTNKYKANNEPRIVLGG